MRRSRTSQASRSAFRANIANLDIVEESICSSTRTELFFLPVVLAHPGTIIDGNTRLKMAEKAGLETFPVYMVRVNSSTWPKHLAPRFNQVGGVRPTQDEAYKAAIDMMGENLNSTDSQTAQGPPGRHRGR